MEVGNRHTKRVMKDRIVGNLGVKAKLNSAVQRSRLSSVPAVVVKIFVNSTRARYGSVSSSSITTFETSTSTLSSLLARNFGSQFVLPVARVDDIGDAAF